MATGKRGRPPEPAKSAEKGADGVLYARVPNELLLSLDAWASRLNKGSLGPQWTRNDVIRAVLQRAVDERGKKGEQP